MPVQTRSATNSIQRAKDTGRIIIEVRFRCEKNCAICRCDMYGDKVYHLPCGHTFHVECFKNQLQNMRHNPHKCACCRYDLLDALQQNTDLYEMVPHSVLQSYRREDAFLELLAIYHLISASGSTLENAVIINTPLINIPPPQPVEPFPLVEDNNMDVYNNTEVDNNMDVDNNVSEETNSLDSEDLWFNNSRMFHRNIHINYSVQDQSYNSVHINDDTFNIEPIPINDISFNIQPIPYGNYEIDDYISDYEDLSSTDSMPELMAEPHELDTPLSDNIDYGSCFSDTTNTSSNTDTDTDTDSNTDNNTISI